MRGNGRTAHEVLPLDALRQDARVQSHVANRRERTRRMSVGCIGGSFVGLFRVLASTSKRCGLPTAQ
jgi:hypothetical protein